jgi:hypothetical protein
MTLMSRRLIRFFIFLIDGGQCHGDIILNAIYIPVTCGDNDVDEDASQAFFLSFDFSFGAILVVKSALICIAFYSPRFALEYFTCIHKLCSFLWFRAFI